MQNLKSCGFLSYLIISVFLIFIAPKADGQINSYAKVTAISGTTLTLSNVNQTFHTFATGEQIVIMQMQDDVIGSNTSNNSSFGSLSSISNAGIYEFATINSVSGMPTSLTITKSTFFTYHLTANTSVQIISLNKLSTGNFTTTANITGLAWNGSIGGVVAFQVGGTLTLANSVSADGLGFRGGSLNSNYEVACEPNVYDTSSTNYAFKGEGIYSSAAINYTNRTGRAPLLNGGGGGSDDNGGGGGGGNFTAGGQGGQGWTCSSGTASGGLGGISLGSYVNGYSRIFMGGGGGSGQQNNSVGTAGTAGGGIIIMVGNSLTTSCTGNIKISANGVAASNSGNDGAGGAGAGGTIAVQFNTFNVTSGCPLTLQANGGNGGNVGNGNAHGAGGGGGQGAIIYSGASPSSNMTTTTISGTGGSNSSSAGAVSAGNGDGTTNAGILTTAIALPVNFISFNAFKNGDEAMLDWSIAASSQIVTFNIQRSADGSSFNTIASMNSREAANDNNYSFTDKNPDEGNNYYRIEEIDFAGNKIYSSIAVVNKNAFTNSFAIYPNPSDGNFSIKLNEKGNFTLSVDDIAGKNVYTKNYQTSGNIISVKIDRNLASGVYLIRLKGNGRTQIGKIIIK